LWKTTLGNEEEERVRRFGLRFKFDLGFNFGFKFGLRGWRLGIENKGLRD
jgi:hypothetical protein